MLMVLKAQNLYNVAVRKRYVDTYSLFEDADRLYKSIKLDGLQKTTVKYTDEDENEIAKTGEDIPVEMRAMTAAIATLIYRWYAKDEERLRKHFGIPVPIVDVLGIHSCYGKGNDMLPCINVDELIKAYVGEN